MANKKTKVRISGLDRFFYYLMVLTTFGGAYFFKVIIAKAIEDSIKTE